MWLEIALILIFILLNGFFAGSEIAVVSVRKTRITELAKLGRKNAGILQNLKSDPDRFLATVQIGVTIVGALASAIGGAAAVQSLQPVIAKSPVSFIAHSSKAISIAVVVIIISYLSLILGELAPKAMALRNPEKMALIVARPIQAFSRVFSFFVTLLTSSTNAVLKLFGAKPFSHMSYVTEEEIKMFIREGRDRGFFEPTEEELIRSIFEFTDLSAREIMVPITKVIAFPANAPLEDLLSRISEEEFSRYPVYKGELSNIVGVLYVKDLFKKLAEKAPVKTGEILRQPFFTPESIKISSLLKQMQRRRIHIAVVMNEYGAVTGIVTIEDIIEEIVGEIRDEYDFERPVISLKDGSFRVDASISVRDLRDDHGIELPESPDYETLGGFIIANLQRFPAEGERVSIKGWNVLIEQTDGRRIERVVLRKKPGKG